MVLTSCAPYQSRTVFGVYFTSTTTNGRGLMRIYQSNIGEIEEPLPPSGKLIDLASTDYYLLLRYDPVYMEGANCPMVEWFVDGISRQRDKPNHTFSFGNPRDGTHKIRMVAFWVTAGDNEFICTTTQEIMVRT
jgi:hypothetical protein